MIQLTVGDLREALKNVSGSTPVVIEIGGDEGAYGDLIKVDGAMENSDHGFLITGETIEPEPTDDFDELENLAAAQLFDRFLANSKDKESE